MATTPTKPDVEARTALAGTTVPGWPREESVASSLSDGGHSRDEQHSSSDDPGQQNSTTPSPRDALQALLAFSALHEQVRRRKALAARHNGFDAAAKVEQPESEPSKFGSPEFEPDEQFVLDEVLHLVAARAVSITGADGLAIALAQNNEIVLRAAAGTVRPDVGARIDRDSAFSGASFRTAQVVMCDDTETDPRVNLQACRRLGARSMIAVPLCGRRRVIGLLEAFSSWPFGFNDSDVRNLSLLAELVVGALRPEDEDRFAESADVAATKLEAPSAIEVAPANAPVNVPAPATHSEAAPVASPIPVLPPKAVITPSVVPAKPAEVKAAEVKPDEIRPAPISAAETETAAKPEALPELTFGQLEPARLARPGAMILLLCIVIAAAFAAGVWLKVKNSQLGGAMVTNKLASTMVSEKPAHAPPANLTSTAANTPPATAPATSAAGTNAAPDAISDANEPMNTPASPQDLAKFPRVTGIRHWSSADSSTVVLDLEDQVQYEAHRLTSPERIYFDLRDTQLTADAAKSIDVAGDTLLNRVRVAQPVAGMTRIVLETRADSNFSVSLEPNPYRLLIEVRKLGVTPKAAVNLFPNAGADKGKLAIVVPPPTREDLQLRAHVPKLRIVVDAGHGGWDLGTVGRRGLLEKDLVLEIAQRLGKLLQSRLGADVIYTRQDDNYIPLDERAEIANQSQADLFVSVHANYSDLPSARGVETYYTNSFSVPGSREGSAKLLDANTASGAKNAVTPMLSPADLHERIEQSRRLAASVQRALYGTLVVQNPGLRDRGVKEAGFVVLTESAMPGILAEVSFVSSPTDEQKLRSDGYREQIAEALYKGIARYAASSKGVKVAAK